MLDPASLILGLFGGAGGALTVERYRHSKDLRRRGAAGLGPIFAMLVEADPDRLAINAGPHSDEQIRDLWERSIEHDAALQTLALELSSRGSEIAVELAGSIQRSLNATSWLVRHVLNPPPGGYDVEAAINDARAKHVEARDLAERLGAELRRM